MNFMFDCAVIHVFSLETFYHVFKHASERIDSKRGEFKSLLTWFRAFHVNSNIDKRFIGHYICGAAIFLGKVGFDRTAICVIPVLVHFRTFRGFSPVCVLVCPSLMYSRKRFRSKSVFICESPPKDPSVPFPASSRRKYSCCCCFFNGQ